MADKYIKPDQFFTGIQRLISIINGKIGDVELNTSNKTLNGAINELIDKINNIEIGGGVDSPPDLSEYVKISDLANVAKSGSYEDLINKPIIPSLTGLATESYVIDKINEAKLSESEIDLSEYAKTTELSNIAKSGSYNDLVDKPTILSESYINTLINTQINDSITKAINSQY